MPSLLRRELGNDHRRRPIPWTRKQAIKTPPSQDPTRFHISPFISTSNRTHSPLSYCQTQGFIAAQRSCFIKQRRPAVVFHTIVRRRTKCIPTSDQTLCPVGISREKPHQKQIVHHQCPTLCSRKRPPGATQKASNTRSKTQDETL